MNMKKLFLHLTILSALFLVACNGNEDPIDQTTGEPTHLILCEGLMGKNDSKLVAYNFITKAQNDDFFLSINKRGLGDSGNDMLKHGSKIYIAVTGSSTIEIINAETGKSVGQIQMRTDNGNAKEPRSLAAHNGKVYVTSFDNTVSRIDTASLKIDGSVIVGRNPEGICISNNKIYVANSGGLDWETGNYDTTVSVVDINTFKEEKKIEVGKNVYQVFADSEGDIYVSTRAIYEQAEPTFNRIDAKTGKVETIQDIEPGKFVIANDKAYIIIEDYKLEQAKVVVYDCKEEKISTENFITDNTKMGMPYGISVDALSGDIFLTEIEKYTIPGNVYSFDKNGKLKFKLKNVGISPSQVLPLH